MQLGMPTLIENKTFEDNVNLAKELNLNFIELNMNFPDCQLDFLEKTEELIKAGDQAHLYFTIHMDENLNVAEFNPLVREAYLETVRRTIEAAKKLLVLRDKYGDTAQPLTLNIHMNHGIVMTLPDKKVMVYEQNFDEYMNNFRKFRELVEEWIGNSDLVIAIENTDGFREFEKKAIEYLLESKKFVLTWDIGHSKVMGESDMEFILEHNSKLRHFHIHDANEKTGKNHLALGDGEIDLHERLRIANACNARCVLETKTIAALKKSIAWIR